MKKHLFILTVSSVLLLNGYGRPSVASSAQRESSNGVIESSSQDELIAGQAARIRELEQQEVDLRKSIAE